MWKCSIHVKFKIERAICFIKYYELWKSEHQIKRTFEQVYILLLGLMWMKYALDSIDPCKAKREISKTPSAC